MADREHMTNALRKIGESQMNSPDQEEYPEEGMSVFQSLLENLRQDLLYKRDRVGRARLPGTRAAGLEMAARKVEALMANDPPEEFIRQAAERIARTEVALTANSSAPSDAEWADIWDHAYTDSVRARYVAMARAAFRV